MNLTSLIFLFIFLAFLIIIARFAKEVIKISGEKASQPSANCWISKKYLLSKAERSFYGVLRQVIEDADISSKVRLEDIVGVDPKIKGRLKQSLRNRIKSRHIDFVVCDPGTMEIKLCIELDDSSHKRKDRIERDKFVDSVLNQTGLNCVRFPASSSYTRTDLLNKISPFYQSTANKALGVNSETLRSSESTS